MRCYFSFLVLSKACTVSHAEHHGQTKRAAATTKGLTSLASCRGHFGETL